MNSEIAAPSPLRTKLPPILGIFITIFVDMLGFGMAIPDIQLRAKSLVEGGGGPMVGLAIAMFSIAQLLTAPFLGRLSDHVGRRKILLITTLLSAVSFAFYAHANTLWVVFAARAIAGVAGANIGVAYAYVADITTPENRSKGMGIIGAAFGLGFIFGPVLGAILVTANHGSPLLLGYTAATISVINFLYVYFVLPESMNGAPVERRGWFENFRLAFSTPRLAILLAMFLAFNIGFSNLESTFFQLLTAKSWIFHLRDSEIGHHIGHMNFARFVELVNTDGRIAGAMILFYVGLISATMQGGLIRKVVPRFGEVKVLRFAYLCQVPAFILLPFMPLWAPMLLAILLLGTGTGLSQPAMSSLISRNAPKDIQGGIFGITQSLGALARIAGPLLGNTLFPIKPFAPYLAAALLISIPAIASWSLRMPSEG